MMKRPALIVISLASIAACSLAQATATTLSTGHLSKLTETRLLTSTFGLSKKGARESKPKPKRHASFIDVPVPTHQQRIKRVAREDARVPVAERGDERTTLQGGGSGGRPPGLRGGHG